MEDWDALLEGMAAEGSSADLDLRRTASHEEGGTEGEDERVVRPLQPLITSSSLKKISSSKQQLTASIEASASADRRLRVMEPVTLDPSSGLRIAERAIGSLDMKTRMSGKRVFSLAQISKLPPNTLSEISGKAGQPSSQVGDVVVMGCIASRSIRATKTSNKSMLVWGLSDLSQNQISVYIFDSAIAELKNEDLGSVVAILNPQFLNNQNSGHARVGSGVGLSINKKGQVLCVGKAADFGICEGTRKDGSRCSCVVNRAVSSFCSVHVAAELKKTTSKRMELNSVAIPVRNPSQVTGIAFRNLSEGFAMGKKGPQSKSLTGVTVGVSKHAQISTVVTSHLASLSDADKSRLSQAAPLGMRYLSHISGDSGTRRRISLAGPLGLHQLTTPVPVVPSARGVKSNADAVSSLPSDAPQFIVLEDVDPNDPFRDLPLHIVRPPTATSAPVSNVSTVASPESLMTGNALNTPASSAALSSSEKENGRDGKGEDVSVAPNAKRSRLAALVGVSINDAESVASSIKASPFEPPSGNRGAMNASINSRIERLAHEEKLALQVASTTSTQVIVHRCESCRRTFQTFPTDCKARSHTIAKVNAIKRFFECSNCRYRTHTINQVIPSVPCDKCKRTGTWAPCSMSRKDSTGLSKATGTGAQEKLQTHTWGHDHEIGYSGF
eukprot:ANDGO_02784.mRNA.1 Protein MCM10 homolog